MFSLFRKNKKVQHPLFGELVYRSNRAANKKSLPGFWAGRLQLVGQTPTSLVIWGDKNTAPHPKQEALFNRVVNDIEQYINESKAGLLAQIQADGKLEKKPQATLEQLYIQAYPMSARLQEDLNANLEGVAWGFEFSIDSKGEGDLMQGYSAYVDLNLHPKFPFTYY